MRIEGYLYISVTIILTVYGQLILKWRMEKIGLLPNSLSDKCILLFQQVLDPWMWSVAVAMLISVISWMISMTKFELSYAYPFMSLTFVLVLLLSGLLFNEPVTARKAIGVLLIILGVSVGIK